MGVEAAESNMSTVTKAKIVVLCVSAVLFVVINEKPLVPKDPRLVAYEDWLKPIERVVSHSSSSPTLLQERPIKLRFHSDYPEFQADWTLMTTGDVNNDTRVLRVLQLAREAQIFILSAPDGYSGPRMKLSVERNRNTFEAEFTRAQIEDNLQAHSMIKLLEIYAGQTQSPAELSQP